MACACGSTESASATAKGISVAQQAIDAIDGYLDGKTSGDSARDKLDELTDEMDYVDDLPRDTAQEEEHYAADWSIRLDLTGAVSQILLDQYNGDNESFDKIVDVRNDIAEAAGLETR
ncbi:MAG: hypothetical protein LUD72_03010 [Bacteroidales bacterium]|nr:hypothetical protein [Bacteroidales bacterium]